MSLALEISLIVLALTASTFLGFGAVAMAINFYRDWKEGREALRDRSEEVA